MPASFSKKFREHMEAEREGAASEVRETDPNEPHLRLAICQICRTIDELPDMGPRPDPRGDDPFLERVVAEHRNRHPRSIDVEHGPMAVGRVAVRNWRDPKHKAEIMTQLGHSIKGFDASVYDLRDNLKEDALRCFSNHHRPENGCSDYMSESKRIGNSLPTEATAAEDKHRAELMKDHKVAVFLCHSCPVHSWVTHKKVTA